MTSPTADTSRLTEWWASSDRAMFAAVGVLIAASLVLSLAASPAIALRKGLDATHFIERHALFSLAGVAIMAALSTLAPAGVRKFSYALFALSFAALTLTPFLAPEINGARRWLSVAGWSMQPSEFVKPAFVVLSAWLLSQARERPDMPALPLAFVSLAAVAGLVAIQPDVGQTVLICAVWLLMFFLSGQSFRATAVLLGAGAAAFAIAYVSFDHVQNRVARFLDPSSGDNTQIERAMRSFTEGGFLGRGPGSGSVKENLPDAHADFVFAVAAEEYGAVFCLAILVTFAFVVMRAFLRGASEEDDANRLAICGLAAMFGLQAAINMAVNSGLTPAKGLTLPFISAGGSSILATSITLGLLLALLRRRPDGGNLNP